MRSRLTMDCYSKPTWPYSSVVPVLSRISSSLTKTSLLHSAEFGKIHLKLQINSPGCSFLKHSNPAPSLEFAIARRQTRLGTGNVLANGNKTLPLSPARTSVRLGTAQCSEVQQVQPSPLPASLQWCFSIKVAMTTSFRSKEKKLDQFMNSLLAMMPQLNHRVQGLLTTEYQLGESHSSFWDSVIPAVKGNPY